MTDYTINLQTTFKRNYFQSFQYQDINTMKIPRYDQQTSSSDIQIMENDLETQTNHIVPKITTIAQMGKNKVTDSVQTDLTIIDRQQSIEYVERN